jgi:hypothetical protein
VVTTGRECSVGTYEEENVVSDDEAKAEATAGVNDWNASIIAEFRANE